MKTIKILIVLLLFQFTTYSQSISTKIIKHYKTEIVKSGSGIEYYNNTYYIISDNQNNIFTTNNFEEYSTIKAIQTSNTSLVEKNKKLDFEGLGKINYNNKTYLIIVSSGSKLHTRDTVYLFDIKTNKIISKRNFRNIYNSLQKKSNTTKDFNIEAITETSDKILLLQRGNTNGQNNIFTFNKTKFIEYLLNKTNKLNFTVKNYNLPLKNNILSGFSGATTINDSTILFTCSIENTKSAYADGETMCSYIGVVWLNTDKIIFKALKNKHKSIVKTKLESITIKKFNKNIYRVITSSDNDNGITEFYEIDLTINY